MNYVNYMHLIAALPQLGVLCYALRLNRRFGVAKVGWMLVGSLALLAVLCLLYFSAPFQPFAPTIKLDAAYGFAAMFLLTIMIFLEKSLNDRARIQEILQQSKTMLETRVAFETAELTKANDKLIRAAEDLQAEIEERKKV